MRRHRTILITWRRHVEYTPAEFSFARYTPAFLISILGTIGMFVIGEPALAVVFIAIGLLPVPILHRRTKLRVRSDHVAVFRQPFYGNWFTWLAFLMFLIVLSCVAEILVGDVQAWRELFVAILAGVLMTLSLRGAYRFRGPLRVSAHRVSLGDGRHFDLATDSIGIITPKQGVPGISITDSRNASSEPANIAPPPYNLDFDTMLSTFEQLQRWTTDGITASPADIHAMLTVTPPVGLAVGESVELTIPVDEDPAQ